MMSQIKAINTKQLQRINDIATKKFNRRISSLAMQHVDPDGIHLLRSLMLHEHSAGVAVDPHLRCEVLIKKTGQEEAVEAMIDVEIKDYQSFGSVAHNAPQVMVDN